MGQLGLGNRTNYSSPKQVGALTNWLSVVGGYSFIAAQKLMELYGLGARTNGRWVWVTLLTIHLPSKLGALTTWLNYGWVEHTI
jgi:hypothetical protein